MNCFHCGAPLSDDQAACFTCKEPRAVRANWVAWVDAEIAKLEAHGAKVLQFPKDRAIQE